MPNPSPKTAPKARTLILGAILGLLVLLGIGLWLLLPSGTPQPGAEGKEIAMAFLEQVRLGKTAEAWTGSSAEFKSYMGKDTLRDFAKKTPALREKLDFVSMETTKINGLDRKIFSFRAPKSLKQIKVTLAPYPGSNPLNFRVEHIEVE
jgi:hypothetical protein